jgi:hypothetical protein
MIGIENLGRFEEQPLVPEGGIHTIRKAADMLADFGRNGDTYLIHAAEGETVLPMEVLESNPRLRKMIFKQIEELGLEPERYIVGNKLNSINPVTGKPEFFFGKIFRSVKKVFKPVVKAIQTVAPIALPILAPIALPFLPLPLSAGIGGMVGGLIAGQDAGSAFKSGLLSGGLAGLGNIAFGGPSGFGSGTFFGSRLNPTATLGSYFAPGGLGSAGPPTSITNPLSGALSGSTSPSNLISGAQSGLPGGSASGFVGGGDTITSFGTGTTPLAMASRASPTPMASPVPINLSSGPVYTPPVMDVVPPMDFGIGTPLAVDQSVKSVVSPPVIPDAGNINYQQIAGIGTSPNVVPTSGTIPQQIAPPSGGGGILDSLKSGVDKTKSFVGGIYDNYLSPSRASIQPSAADIGAAYQTKLGEYAAQGITLGPAEQKALYDTTQASMQPSFFRKYGPIAGVGLGGILALDALSKPEEEGPLTMAELQEETGPTGTELYRQDPTRYGFDQSFYGRNPYYQAIRYTPPYVQAKEGGEIVGPGTATSDSVPALLSDGEFVMTAGAVRGAGGGNRAEGARKMYDMMKQFEQRVTAA